MTASLKKMRVIFYSTSVINSIAGGWGRWGWTNSRYVWIVDVVQLLSQVEAGAVGCGAVSLFGSAREHACFQETWVCSAEEAGEGWKKKGAVGEAQGGTHRTVSNVFLWPKPQRRWGEMEQFVSSGSCWELCKGIRDSCKGGAVQLLLNSFIQSSCLLWIFSY